MYQRGADKKIMTHYFSFLNIPLIFYLYYLSSIVFFFVYIFCKFFVSLKKAKVLLIPCMTTSRRNVWAFDFNTGDLIDSAFIPYSSPMLQTPRRVLQLSKTQVLVADQLSNAVQLFDTSGAYIRVYCPAGGVNTNILNNIRDLAFTPTGNIIVSNAGTAGFAQNTVQQFDHYGNFLNTFVSDTVVNSPYNFLYRTNDLLLSCSSGLHDVIKFNKTSGLFLGDFLYAALNFPQQITQLDSGKVAICEFSGVLSGIRIYDSTGVLTDTLKGVTGIRGNWKLPNGNFIVTTGVAVSEVNGVTGSLVRTIVTGYNFTCISVFDPNMITESNESNIEIPSEYKLFNNYPNPFNPTTNIKYQITNNKFVTLKIYDVLGKEVKTLVNENKPAGVYEVTWDASSNSSGVYFYKITAGNFTETKRMLLIK